MPHAVIPIVMFHSDPYSHTYYYVFILIITKIKICIETINLFLTYVKYEIGLQHTMNVLFQFDFTMHNSL